MLDAAVLIFDFELREHAETIAVVIHIAAIKAETAAIPAVAEPEAHGVGALVELVGDVVGPALHALFVVGPAGDQRIIADFYAVDFRFDQAEGAQIQACTLRLRLDRDFRTHQRQMAMVGFRFRPGRSHKVGDMLVFLHEAGLEVQGGAGIAQRLVRGGHELHGGEDLFA